MYRTVADIPDDFELIQIDMVVWSILKDVEYDGDIFNDYGCLFVKYKIKTPPPFPGATVLYNDKDEVEEVYGIENTVPYLDRPVDKIYPLEEN